MRTCTREVADNTGSISLDFSFLVKRFSDENTPSFSTLCDAGSSSVVISESIRNIVQPMNMGRIAAGLYERIEKKSGNFLKYGGEIPAAGSTAGEWDGCVCRTIYRNR